MLRSICTAIVLFTAFAPAYAALKSTDPSTVCNYLSEVGLVSRGWKNQYDNEYGCSSSYKALGGAPLTNNLAYYVKGGPSTASTAYLVVNINDRSAATAAHKELLLAAEALSLKATGSKLPKEVSTYITRGEKGSAKVGSATIKIVRVDWPTGKGYEVKVFFE